MLAHLTSDKGEAIPITPVTRDGFAAWLIAAAESDRTWLKATGFVAEPGKIGLLPGPGEDATPELGRADHGAPTVNGHGRGASAGAAT